MTYQTHHLAALFHSFATLMTSERDALCQMDGLIGDADHGIAMAQGMVAAQAAVAALGDVTLQDQFNAAAKAFLDAVGASSGPLYATAFLRAGKVTGQRREMELTETPQIIVAMADGIAQRGKAKPGQKTMLDAWAPAAAAIGSGSLRTDVAKARQAAQSGALATSDMIATIGRAALLGARSLGHPDPGAASAAMLITVFCDQIERLAQAQDIS